MARKNRALVGLGSYLFNRPDVCNAHNAGPGNNQFLPGGNPFFGQPKHINSATYLGGGRNFGHLVAGSAFLWARVPSIEGKTINPVGPDVPSWTRRAIDATTSDIFLWYVEVFI